MNVLFPWPFFTNFPAVASLMKKQMFEINFCSLNWDVWFTRYLFQTESGLSIKIIPGCPRTTPPPLLQRRFLTTQSYRTRFRVCFWGNLMDFLAYLCRDGEGGRILLRWKRCAMTQSKNAGLNPVWNSMQLPTIMTMAIAMGFELSEYKKNYILKLHTNSNYILFIILLCSKWCYSKSRTRTFR